MRPVIVGERTNVIGSRQFKELIVEEKFEEASEIGRAQVRGGAQVLDVCLANPDRDESADMRPLHGLRDPQGQGPADDRLHRRARARAGAHAVPGQGHRQLDQSRGRRGALRAGGAADPDATAARWWWAASTRTSSRAWRSPASASSPSRSARTPCSPASTALPERDLIFDPLVFPVGTGDANYIGSAVETIEGVRAIKAALPARQDRSLASPTSRSGCPPRGARC